MDVVAPSNYLSLSLAIPREDVNVAALHLSGLRAGGPGRGSPGRVPVNTESFSARPLERVPVDAHDSFRSSGLT
ncbi:MAG: hypothetical protein ACQET1_06070, partial [Gemmatimonadota bacterium]